VKPIENRISLFVLFMLLSAYSFASDVVPFSIKRIKPVGAGYFELVGPGKIRTGDKVFPYEETKYIKRVNIGTMTSVPDSNKGCILAYSSEGYTENISVRNQSCGEILSIFSAIK